MNKEICFLVLQGNSLDLVLVPGTLVVSLRRAMPVEKGWGLKCLIALPHGLISCQKQESKWFGSQLKMKFNSGRDFICI